MVGGIAQAREVIASDGTLIGKVGHLREGGVKPTRNDPADHQHHSRPLAWIDHIDAHVHLNEPLADIRASARPPSPATPRRFRRTSGR